MRSGALSLLLISSVRSRTYIAWMAGACLLYWATAKLGLEYAVVGHTVTLLWPPSGIALAAILLGGYRMWPSIALGAVIANATTGVPPLTLFIITLGNTLEPLCGAVLLRSGDSFSHGLNKVSGVIALLLYGAVTSTAVSASLGTLGLLIGHKISIGDVGPTWLAWWLGDGLGVLVVSPLLLTVCAPAPLLTPPLFSLRGLEAGVMAIALVVVSDWIFGNPQFSGAGYFPISLSLLLFAIWGALRFGAFGTVLVTLIASSLAIWGTVRGTGPFAEGSAMESLVRWCLFADVMAVTGLLLAAASSERENALTALKSAKNDLERLVCQRTAELTHANAELQTALVERRRLQLEMDQISEERRKTIGQELHDSLGQQLTGVALLVQSLHETLVAKSAFEAPTVCQLGDLINESIAKVRAVSRGLYPVVLESRGLASALHDLSEHTRSFSEVKCIARCAIAGQMMDRATELNLYRIAQEAVSNALRHSGAKTISITLSGGPAGYVLTIEDDGIGINRESPKSFPTVGLRSMQSRAELIMAALEIGERPGGGTVVRVSGPLGYRGTH